MIGLNTSKILAIRLNTKEQEQLKTIAQKYGYNSKGKLIKNLAFRDLKPFLSKQELETLQTLILELNAIGRNLNQFTKIANKYHALRNIDTKLANEAIKSISELIDELQSIVIR